MINVIHHNDKPEPKAPGFVSCAVCRREVPDTSTLLYEAADYAFWFCGSECYQFWQDEQHKKKER